MKLRFGVSQTKAYSLNSDTSWNTNIEKGCKNLRKIISIRLARAVYVNQSGSYLILRVLYLSFNADIFGAKTMLVSSFLSLLNNEGPTKILETQIRHQ